MKVITEFDALRQELNKNRRAGKTIGFVPTMGYLHEGHLSLLRAARERTGCVVMSIYVNPAQFGRGEDFAEYPRDLDNDCRQAEANGCDIVFHPRNSHMYPPGYATYVHVEGITDVLCGLSRPTHFRGVTTVVTKLFNLITPDMAFFGRKDAQQSLVIKKMVEDLNMNTEIVVCPTVREADGTAMSSRNAYLTPGERAAAPLLHQALTKAAELIHAGEKNAQVIRDYLYGRISEEPLAEVEYAEVVDAGNLHDIDVITGSVLLALAVRMKETKTRLIDNKIVEV